MSIHHNTTKRYTIKHAGKGIVHFLMEVAGHTSRSPMTKSPSCNLVENATVDHLLEADLSLKRSVYRHDFTVRWCGSRQGANLNATKLVQGSFRDVYELPMGESLGDMMLDSRIH